MPKDVAILSASQLTCDKDFMMHVLKNSLFPD